MYSFVLMALALRTDSHLSSVRDWCSRNHFGGFCTREVEGQNEHWHWIIFTDKPIKNVRQSLTRAVPLAGNGAYSLTVCRDVEKYQRYICKGTAEGSGCEVCWINLLEDKTEEYHAAYWAEHKKLKRKCGNMLEAVLLECQQQQVTWDDRQKISKIYIKELCNANKPINLFSVRSNVNLLQVKLCPTDRALEQLCEQV